MNNTNWKINRQFLIASLLSLVAAQSLTPSNSEAALVISGVIPVSYGALAIFTPMGALFAVMGDKPVRIIGGALLAGVVVVLDEQVGDWQWSEIDLDKATQLGITEQERQAYNQDLSLLNSFVSEMNHAESTKEAKAMWEQFRPELSSETQVVLQKITGLSQ